MSKIVVDIEADGQCPGIFSMVCFGAVHVTNEGIQDTFYGKTAPLANADWAPAALAVSGHTREEHLKFENPWIVMKQFEEWLLNIKTTTNSRRLFFVSDNAGFDWQFINYYFHLTLGYNPFGHSSTDMSDLFKGMKRDMFKSFKYLRKTKHTHNPVDDATGNAEALLAMKKMGLKIKL